MSQVIDLPKSFSFATVSGKLMAGLPSGGLNMTPLWLLMNPLLGTLILCHPGERGLSLVETEVIKKLSAHHVIKNHALRV